MDRRGRPWESLEDNPTVLSTGYFPDDAETRAMRSRMDDRCAELMVIHDNTTHLEGGPSPRNLARWHSLQQANLVAEAILAPVRKLPVEILGEIFIYALPELSIDGALEIPPAAFEMIDGERWFPEDVRQSVREVCRRWNNVALNTPRFWTSLTIDEYAAFSGFEMGIVHSRSQLLNIYISEGAFARHADDFVRLLRLEMHRIQQLVYAVPWYPEVCGIFPEDELTDALSLKVFISTSDPTSDPDPTVRYDLGNIHAPKLEFAALVDDPLILAHKFSADSLRNLRRLLMRTTPESAQCAKFFLEFLANCPAVEELEICCMSSIWEWAPYTGPKIPMLSLEHLAIADSSDAEIATFFESIRAPNLESLSIIMADDLAPQAGQPSLTGQGLRALQADSGLSHSLKKLELGVLDLVEDGIAAPLLPQFANLVSLNFMNCIVSDAVLVSLMPTSSSGVWPCPHLSRLTFTEVEFSLPGDSLVDLVRIRACSYYPGNRRTFITIEGCNVVDQEGLYAIELRMLARKHYPLCIKARRPGGSSGGNGNGNDNGGGGSDDHDDDDDY